MTRVNAGIPVSQLPSKQLLAEHREIKRLPRHLSKYGFSPDKLVTTPKEFKLGKGHVLFFICKGRYTFKRYTELYVECIRRGFNVQYYGNNWDIYIDYPLLYNDLTPSSEAVKELLKRFKERGIKLIKNPKQNGTD